MSATTYTVECCVVCGVKFDDVLDNWRTLKDKGLQSLIRFANIRGDTCLSEYLLSTADPVAIHNRCHTDYTHKRHLQHDNHASESEPSKKLRSSTTGFDWKQHCFLCGQCLKIDARHPDRSDVRQTQTLEIHQSVMMKCMERNDQWALEVRGRLETCSDLPAVEAQYHKGCHRDFFAGLVRCQDTTVSDGARSAGKQALMKDAFVKTCAWLENAADELYTVPEVQAKMIEIAGCVENSYSMRHFQSLLQERYGDSLVICDVRGRQNVVCFQNLAKRIIHDKWYDEREKTVESESKRVVVAAARLIKASILEASYSDDEYPLNSTLQDPGLLKECVPELVSIFMENLVTDELKQVAIGHSLVQAARPHSVIAPILFALGVSLDHNFGSKQLLQLLSRLGFCISYDEVCRYKQSVLQGHGQEQLNSFPDAFTQWAADNVDHNVATLDGLGTFHGMGVIAMAVQQNTELLRSGSFGEKAVARCKRTPVSQVIKNTGIPVHYYTAPNMPPLAQMTFKAICELQFPYSLPSSINANLLWQVGWYFRGESEPRPNWSGFMQDVTVGEHPPCADIRLLPVIDMNPGDRSCILSTLLFIVNQAKLLNMETPCVTFDQPLWLKAVEVVHSESLDIVCRLGMFHMIMSFLGSIGVVMCGSGLADALECCYGPNTVAQMMTGKAVARAIRAHLLADSALHVLLLRLLFDDDDDDDVNVDGMSADVTLTDVDVNALRGVYDDVVANKSVLTESPDCLVKLDLAFSELKTALAAQSRTAKSWIQYSEYIDTLKLVIRAERTSDWNLHLIGVSQMLNLFAATGHCHYAKCARLYLQMMLQLPETHVWLYNKFQSGNHSIRRSDRYWAGLSTDLVIEQVMMRAVKGRGGLTHGRGMTESVRSVWVHSMHKCAGVHAAISCLAGCDVTHDADHADQGKARASRDYADLKKVLEWFAVHNPFDVTDSRLRSISTGIVAGDPEEITCDSAEEVGCAVMQEMDNKTFTEVVLRKANRIHPLSYMNKKVKIGKGHIVIDPDVLFTRLLIVMAQSGDTESCFQHELTTVPTALFKGEGLRKTNKAVLAKELTKSVDTSYQPDFTGKYVLDGGCLLHKVVWPKSGTYRDVLHAYVSFVGRRYSDCVVVFDGYGNGPTVKDHEHTRRATLSAPTVSIEEHMPLYRNQGAFMTNGENKKHFVGLLSQCLLEHGFPVLQAADDADTLIVRTALDIAAKKTAVTVVADDTDILAMLVHHLQPDMADIYMLSEITRLRSARRAVVPIRAVCEAIGETACHQLLAVHAVSGCDTTSALYGHGKSSVFKKVTQNPDTLPLTDVLSSTHATQSEVAEAGLKLLVLLYGGKPSDTLDHMRYTAYMSLIATGKTRPRPERLPPTERAAYFHVLRAHLQIIQWQSLMMVELKPEEWGWHVQDSAYVPISTDLQPAPADVLTVIACKCKSTKKPCSSQLCSCRKHGLHCVAACKHCNGESCENASEVSAVDMNLDDDVDGEDDDEMLMAEDPELFADAIWIDEEVVG